ncbi:MAG: hypothetical protein E7535_00855 [Ruminococcaceae bacterium]|nr:hypothetical protein [Oscillospiraceae bacterium]
MTQTIVEIKSNFGNDKVKMKIFSQNALSKIDIDYIHTLRRDELIKYGRVRGWTVLDITEWA